MKHLQGTFAAYIFLLISSPGLADSGQLYANFETCELSSGEVIEDCRVGYRTFGERDPDDSDIVVYVSGFTGTSESIANRNFIGPELAIDTEKFFVIAIDPLSNGVSSSPSNSKSQPDRSFPSLSIADMVESQHRLLTEKLNISRIHAVTGISMGGMQTFEWTVRYPQFMNKAVSIVGTPVQTAFDILHWDTQLKTIESLGESDAAYAIVAGLMNMIGYTPEYIASRRAAENYPRYIARLIERTKQGRLFDRVPQLRAMIGHDIGRSAGGSLVDAAAIVEADVLIVVSPTDQAVNPAPSREFAKILGARLVEIDGECGHVAFSCDREALAPVIRAFLDD